MILMSINMLFWNRYTSSIPVKRFTEPECLRIEFSVDENTPDKLPKRPLPDGMVEELSEDGMIVTIRLLNDI